MLASRGATAPVGPLFPSLAQETGSLLLASNAHEAQLLAERAHMLARHGVQARALTAREVQQQEPALRLAPDGAGLVVQSDGQIVSAQSPGAASARCPRSKGQARSDVSVRLLPDGRAERAPDSGGGAGGMPRAPNVQGECSLATQACAPRCRLVPWDVMWPSKQSSRGGRRSCLMSRSSAWSWVPALRRPKERRTQSPCTRSSTSCEAGAGT